MARLHRYRVDRESVTALCAVWWQAEHGEAPPWPLAKPGVLEVPTAERVRELIKRQRPETPGDMAVLAALPAHELLSAARVKAVLDAENWIRAQPTAVLLRALEFARGNGCTTLVSGRERFLPFRHSSGLVLPEELLRSVLATREHVPNLVERKQKRLASVARKGRGRPPRSRR